MSMPFKQINSFRSRVNLWNINEFPKHIFKVTEGKKSLGDKISSFYAVENLMRKNLLFVW